MDEAEVRSIIRQELGVAQATVSVAERLFALERDIEDGKIINKDNFQKELEKFIEKYNKKERNIVSRYISPNWQIITILLTFGGLIGLDIWLSVPFTSIVKMSTAKLALTDPEYRTTVGKAAISALSYHKRTYNFEYRLEQKRSTGYLLIHANRGAKITLYVQTTFDRIKSKEGKHIDPALVIRNTSNPSKREILKTTENIVDFLPINATNFFDFTKNSTANRGGLSKAYYIVSFSFGSTVFNEFSNCQKLPQNIRSLNKACRERPALSANSVLVKGVIEVSSSEAGN